MNQLLPFPRDAVIDGWRAIAIAIVIAGHFVAWRPEPYMHWLPSLLPSPFIGVYIFFFISGAVVTRSAIKEGQGSGRYCIPAFYIRRVFRIVPPLALYLAACSLFAAMGLVRLTPGQTFWAFSYMCNTGFAGCDWLVAHTWSLAFEEQFYLLFPMAFALLAFGTRPPTIGVLGAVSLAMIPLISPIWFGRTGLATIYGLFIVGCFYSRYEPQIGKIISNRPVLFFVTGFTATCVVNKYPYDGSLAEALGQWGYVASIPIVVASSRHLRVTRTILGGRLIGYIGRISYSIYLWQQLATSELFASHSVAVEALAVLAIVLLSALLFETVERPLIEIGRRLSRRKVRTQESCTRQGGYAKTPVR